MDIVNSDKSILSLKKMFFESIIFNREENIDNTKLSLKYDVDLQEVENNIKVIIVTKVYTQNNSINLTLKACGIFNIDNFNNYDEYTIDSIKKQNTVAIMMPYIRSQISLITTQPDLTPIILPIIDVSSLINNQEK